MRAFAAPILFLLPLIGGSAKAEGWTFCVAEAGQGRDIWITEVFPAARDREQLEVDLKAYLKGRGIVAADAQCPAPKDDKIEMANAQYSAAEFHRKLGDALHEVTAPEFAPDP
jgi:hypothetical protein